MPPPLAFTTNNGDIFRPVRTLLAIICILLLLPLTAPGAARKSSSRKPAAKAASSSKSKGKKTTSSRRSRSRRAATQSGPTSDRIRQIQEALASGGFFKHQPSGRWDAQTSAAISSFQAANGLEVTGKLGAWTLKKLEEKHGLPSNSELTESAQSGSINE